MPEIQFQIRWPDGVEDICYSPSLVIKDYLTPDCDYPLNDFLERSRTALQIANQRVLDKYGFPCGRALGQLRQIEMRSDRYRHLDQPIVRVLKFIE